MAQNHARATPKQDQTLHNLTNGRLLFLPCDFGAHLVQVRSRNRPPKSLTTININQCKCPNPIDHNCWILFFLFTAYSAVQFCAARSLIVQCSPVLRRAPLNKRTNWPPPAWPLLQTIEIVWVLVASSAGATANLSRSQLVGSGRLNKL